MTAMMETNKTLHLSMNAFVDAFANAKAGEGIVYAIGDLSCSAPQSPELFGLRKVVWDHYEAGKVRLTQRAREDLRFLNGRAFEYIATKRSLVAKPVATSGLGHSRSKIPAECPG